MNPSDARGRVRTVTTGSFTSPRFVGVDVKGRVADGTEIPVTSGAPDRVVTGVTDSPDDSA